MDNESRKNNIGVIGCCSIERRGVHNQRQDGNGEELNQICISMYT